MKSPILNKRFNLKNQLIKDEFARLKNFKLSDERSPEPSAAEQFGNRIAMGTDESRASDSKSRAFGDYSNRLGDYKFYGEQDQYGTSVGDISADPRTGDLVVKGDYYAKRDFNVPFNEAGGGDNKKIKKNYPLISSYADPMPSQINPMYVNPNEGLGRDYISQQVRNRDAGVDYDQTAIARFGQGDGTQYYMPSQTNTFESTIGRDPSTRSNRGGADYVIGSNFNGSGKLMKEELDTQEASARSAMNARNTANQAVKDAIDSGNFDEAQNILNSGFNTISEEYGNYQKPNKAWRGTGYGSRTQEGTEGGPRMGERPVLQNPGMFYGSRVKDNLEYRRDASADKYNTEYLPTRSEEVDEEAYKRLQKQRINNAKFRMENYMANRKPLEAKFNIPLGLSSGERTGDINFGGQ